MPEYISTIWDDGEKGNVAHLAEHGVTPEEADAVIRSYFRDRERSSTNPSNWVVRGLTPTGRFLLVVFVYLEDLGIVIPVTAYEPRRREF